MVYHLRPERDVESCGGHFVATGTEPWLALDWSPDRFAGRFVEITYRLSLLDEPVRPILRFRQSDGGTVDRIAPAPVLGAAIWIGRLPRRTISVCISPTCRPGPFAFCIERIRRRRWLALVARALRRAPRPARSAVLTRLIGWRDESDVNLAWAIGATPLDDFWAWAKPRTRSYEPDGIDRRRGAAPKVEVRRTGGSETSLGVDASTASPSPLRGRDRDGGSPRAWSCEFEAAGRTPIPYPFPQARGKLPPPARPNLTLFIGATDRLRPGALAYIAEQASRYPQAGLFYGDALRGDQAPVLQPGWSRRLHDARPFLHPPLVVRGFRPWDENARTAFLSTGQLPAHWLSTLDDCEIRPLHRILVESPDAPQRVLSPAWPDVVGTDEAARSLPADASTHATIIIPTRDHPALLRRAITSIRARTTPERFRIIVIDNGSVTAEARALLGALAKKSDLQVMSYPGPFNFSAICNAGADMSQSDVLVFLNDDTEVLSDAWLDRLVALAMEDDVGAVGARLTYPDGRLQHVGVVAGMGDSAGHFGALDPADAPGWAGRNLVVHEVSAVTGACLAVAKQKFEAVGGFDATHLPIELSDIDLCFKLNARGWQTLVDPGVHLMHEESVSRGGATFRRLSVHARERAVFCERWRYILRDDPFFHPALSLYSCRAALG